MSSAVRLDQVTKSFGHGEGSRTPLKAVTLVLPAGSITGCAGPAGAGKTTLLKLLMGLIRPTAGRIEVLGGRPGSVRTLARMGYCPHSPCLPAHLTPRAYLRFCCRLLGTPRAETHERIDRLAGVLALDEMMDQPTSALSRFQQQGLNLMQALICDPDLLLLDEPFTGPYSEAIAALLTERIQRGKTVLLCTQDASRLQKLAGSVLWLEGGQAVWKEAAL